MNNIEISNMKKSIKIILASTVLIVGIILYLGPSLFSTTPAAVQLAVNPLMSSPPKGIYVANDWNKVIPAYVISDPDVDGIRLRFDWKIVEPTKGNYDFSYVLNEFNKVVAYNNDPTTPLASKKKVDFLIGTGDGAPAWLFAAPTNASSETFLEIEHAGNNGGTPQPVTVPVPWDPNYQQGVIALVNNLAATLKSNSAIYDILSLAGFTGINEKTGEIRLPDQDFNATCMAITNPVPTTQLRLRQECAYDSAISIWQNSQPLPFRPSRVLQSYQTLLDATYTAFPDKMVGSNFINTKKDSFPFINEAGQNVRLTPNSMPWISESMINYGFGQYTTKYSALTAFLSDTGGVGTLMINAMANGVYGGFQLNRMLYGAPACGTPCPLGSAEELSFRGALQNGYNAGAKYIEIFPLDVPAFPSAIHDYSEIMNQLDTENPTAPTNVTAVQNVNAVSLSWTASTDNVAVSSYKIYRNGLYINSVNAPQTTFVDTNVQIGFTYSYTVKAVDSSQNTSDFSTPPAQVTMVSLNTEPSIPTNLSYSSLTSTSLVLSWNTSTDDYGVIGYEVFKNGVSIGTTSNTNFNVTGLTATTLYTFTVRAYDIEPLYSLESSPIQVTTLATPKPDLIVLDIITVPANPQPGDTVTFRAKIKNIGTLATNGTIIVNFYMDGSVVPFATNTRTNPLAINGQATLPASVASWVATAGTHTVMAEVDATATQNELDELNNTYTETIGLNDLTSPSTPTNLAVTNTTCSSISLAWTASTDNVGVTGYNIYQDGVFYDSTLTNSYDVIELDELVTHTYTVTAYDSVPNESGASAQVSATTNDCTPPTVVISPPLAASGFGTITISASATDNGTISHVDFYIGNTLVSSSLSAPYTYSWNSTSVPDGMYDITVRATDSHGNVSTSPVHSMSILNQVVDNPPSKPVLSVSNIGQTSLNLSWTASIDDNGISGYSVYKDGSLLGIVSNATTSYSVTGLSPSSQYIFYVEAVDTVGNTTSSDDAFVSTSAQNNNTTGGSGGPSGYCVPGFPCSYLIPYNNGQHTTVSTVNNNPGNQQVTQNNNSNNPEVTVVNPVDGTIIKMNKNIVINAQVLSTGGVSEVKFYTFGKLRCTVKQPPYLCNYTPPKWVWNYTMPVLITTYTTDGNYSSTTAKVKVVK